LRNPFVHDGLAALAVDGSERITASLVPVALYRSQRGLRSPMVARVIAAWARYADAALVDGRFELHDRQADALRDALDHQNYSDAGFLENQEWFGALSQDLHFSADFAAAYRALDQRVRAA